MIGNSNIPPYKSNNSANTSPSRNEIDNLVRESQARFKEAINQSIS